MAITDIFKATRYKNESNDLRQINIDLRNEIDKLNKIIEELNGNDYLDLKNEIEKLDKTRISLEEQINKANTDFKNSQELLNAQMNKLYAEIESKKKLLIDLDDQELFESFALYKPKFGIQNSDQIKSELEKTRFVEEAMIKSGKAALGGEGWTVNGNLAEGKKMVDNMKKLLIRSFNNECDACNNSVKFNNVEQQEKRITKSFDTINNLGKAMKVSISSDYKDLKFKELYLCHEYQIKKQEEKELEKERKTQLREEAKLAREIEEARKDLLKEQSHYKNALLKLNKQLESCSNDAEREILIKKANELQKRLDESDKALTDIDYRAANQKAGYVYIISNIGSFGENVYKIGMTRRLEPMERIDELGDASVPFDFDLHAMIFCDDAPTLENALHKAFDNKKVNMVNKRREFFNVTLDEIEQVVKANFDKSVEFIKIADAEQYRESLKLKPDLTKNTFKQRLC